MSLDVDVCPVPVDLEFTECGLACPDCEDCGVSLTDEAYPDGEGNFYCEGCIEALKTKLEPSAIAYAEKHCRITRRLPRYDPSREYSCTHEEYEAGQKESYTQNAYRAYCRHECTNYDDLWRQEDPDTLHGKLANAAISARIDELLDDAIDQVGEVDLDEEVGDGSDVWTG